MIVRSKSFAILGALLAVACTRAAGPPPGAGQPAVASGEVRNVVFLLADGAGIGYWTAALNAREDAAFGSLPVTGFVETPSANSYVTDSSAGASAYATGVRVTNRTVSMVGCPMPHPNDPPTDPPAGCEPVETWFEVARSRGLATGLVTTTRVVDGSPAAFVAHSPSRYWYEELAEQYSRFGLDVLMGGGSRYFDPATRADGRDLIGELCDDADCLFTLADLAAYSAADRPLVGLFAPDDFDLLDEIPVTLPQMTEAALRRLSRDPDGFVAMIETEGTDNVGHDNAPLEVVTAKMLEFDDAVAAVLEFAERTPGTLVIVTSDHDTGGLALQAVNGGTERERVVANYTTAGHTGAMVPLFAYGPGAERFGGVLENREVGRILMELVAGR